MRRVHLLEIHDQPWFPRFLRDPVTDALQFLLNLGGIYHSIVPLLRQALERTSARRVMDLCSGAGGPWPQISESLQCHGSLVFDVLLTDKYPHTGISPLAAAPAEKNRVHFHACPVDATHVPAELSGFRTLFTSFHHFRPPEARAILQDAVEKHQGIAIFEAPGRHAGTVLLICLIPLGYLLLVPFQHPFRWSRLLWIYLLPVIPFVLFFDGIVSCLRVYSPPELRELVASLPPSGYEWQIGLQRGGFLRVPITYLIGLPHSAAPIKNQTESSVHATDAL